MNRNYIYGNATSNYHKFGWYVSLSTALLTVITFGIAISTPPLSGPFCVANCFQYPFSDIASRFPRDYYWIYTAILLSISFLIMMVALLHVIPQHKKLFGSLGVTFALMSTLLLVTDYFIQVSVIQPSVLAGETDGISLLTQFNPHGIFIVLEEIGFLFMIISFFVLFPIFDSPTKLETTIKWTTIIGFVLAVLSFSIVSIIHGIKREYRFEVIIISITWLELILISFLLSRYFKKQSQLKYN